MTRLVHTLQAWGTRDLPAVLKRELEALDPAALPLQQGLSRASLVTDEPFHVVVIDHGGPGGPVRARVGVFFTGIIAGCSCADDPTPLDGLTEYCEVRVDVDPDTAQARFTLLED